MGLYELDIREKLEKLRERQKARKEKKAKKELKKKLKEQKKQMLALEFAREYKKKNGDEDNEDEGDIPNLNRVVRDSAPRSILVQGKDKVVIKQLRPAKEDRSRRRKNYTTTSDEDHSDIDEDERFGRCLIKKGHTTKIRLLKGLIILVVGLEDTIVMMTAMNMKERVLLGKEDQTRRWIIVRLEVKDLGHDPGHTKENLLPDQKTRRNQFLIG